jgi:hypothetical protein
MAVVSFQIERRPLLKRYPDLDIIPGELKSFRHEADHGEQFIIQRKLLADDIRIPTESSLPEAIIEYDDIPAANLLFIR